MNHSSPITTTASSLPARKITRQQLAAHCGLSVRFIDELTRTGVLGHYKIGKSIRYDLAEVEAALHEHFHVQPTAKARAHPAPGRAGCPQPAAPEPLTHAEETLPLKTPQTPISPEGHDGRQHDGGWRTNRPTTAKARAHPAPGRAGCPQPAAPEPLTHAHETRPLKTPQAPSSPPAAASSSTTATYPHA